jgi:hypothetical protein
VLFASRRFGTSIEHVENTLRSLLDNQEVLSSFKQQQESEEMRVIAYIQCTTQVIMNITTSKGISTDAILKYVT